MRYESELQCFKKFNHKLFRDRFMELGDEQEV